MALPRSTDYGTVILHALLLVSVVTLLATGLRLATDDPQTAWISVLDPILPTENLWLRHLEAGVALAGTLAGYAWYSIRTGLSSRVRVDRARLAALLKPGRSRWGALNVLVYWLLIFSLVIEVATGIYLFAVSERWVLVLHRQSTFVCLAAIATHIVLHGAYGGVAQLTRIFRPAALVLPPAPPDLAEMLAEHLRREAERREAGQAKGTLPPETIVRTATGSDILAKAEDVRPPRTRPIRVAANPFVSAVVLGLAVAGAMVGGEQMTRTTLTIPEIPAHIAPVLDGDLSDPAWAHAQPVRVLTTQGGDFGGTYQSWIEVRGVHDADFAYFAFVWEDPTRSLKHHPVVKTSDGWKVAASRSDRLDEQTFNEDKLAVLVTQPSLPLIGAAIHLARRPLADKPPSSTERGLHYTSGGIADLWQWRASHGGSYGHIDNCHFGSAADSPSPETGSQYAGGFAIDPIPSPYQANYVELPQAGGSVAIVPRRLPRDLSQTTAALGRINADATLSEGEGTRWWMTIAESQPYSPAADALIPIGTVLPGVIMADTIASRADSIRGAARWSAGRWTLELARKLYTGSRFDVPIKSGAMMWVAAFDHAEKRHTRHLRPFQLEVE
ncbi:MAG: cytochrome b/b6 domain-containing protein [Proteobacteria bacterium]|nr:cytochrome b/b6 domain-containing protein [Pseudomonadota bacterium]